MRFWIGDGVGIFVTMPLLWGLQDASHRAMFLVPQSCGETVAYSLLTLRSCGSRLCPAPM